MCWLSFFLLSYLRPSPAVSSLLPSRRQVLFVLTLEFLQYLLLSFLHFDLSLLRCLFSTPSAPRLFSLDERFTPTPCFLFAMPATDSDSAGLMFFQLFDSLFVLSFSSLDVIFPFSPSSSRVCTPAMTKTLLFFRPVQSQRSSLMPRGSPPPPTPPPLSPHPPPPPPPPPPPSACSPYGFFFSPDLFFLNAPRTHCSPPVPMYCVTRSTLLLVTFSVSFSPRRNPPPLAGRLFFFPLLLTYDQVSLHSVSFFLPLKSFLHSFFSCRNLSFPHPLFFRCCEGL